MKKATYYMDYIVDHIAHNPRRISWGFTVITYVMLFLYRVVPQGALVTILFALLAALVEVKDPRVLFRRPPFLLVHIAVFMAFCFVSTIWAWNPGYAVENGESLLKTLLCISLLYVYCSREKSFDAILKAVMWGGYIVCICEVCLYGPVEVINMLLDSSRISNEYINANTLGLVAAISAIIQCHYILERKILKWTDLLLVLAVMMVVISTSKKALIFLVGGCFLLLAWRSLERSAKAFWITVGVFCLGTIIVLCLPIMSGLRTRLMQMVMSLFGVSNSTNNSTALRMLFIESGLDQFFKTPFLGIGMGSPKVLMQQLIGREVYLHNNFVEILTAGGIVGFACYYAMYAYLFYHMLKHWPSRDHTYALVLTLMILLFFMDIAMVSYYLKETYFYFMVMFLYVRKLEKRKGENKQ